MSEEKQIVTVITALSWCDLNFSTDQENSWRKTSKTGYFNLKVLMNSLFHVKSYSLWYYFLSHRKQDCSPAESAAISEEVQVLEALLSQVWVQFIITDWTVGATWPLTCRLDWQTPEGCSDFSFCSYRTTAAAYHLSMMLILFIFKTWRPGAN